MSVFGQRWACPGRARDDYVPVISERKWPLKKTLVIAHIKARSKHSFFTINHNDLSNCTLSIYNIIEEKGNWK